MNKRGKKEKHETEQVQKKIKKLEYGGQLGLRDP